MGKRATNIEVDMFPFLSVLCSVIGVLMLFLMLVLSTRVIEAEQISAEEQEKARNEEIIEDGIPEEEYQRLEQELDQTTVLLQQRLQERERLLLKYQQLMGLLAEKEDLALLPQKPPRKPVELDVPPKIKIVPDKRREVTLKPIFVEVSSDGFLVYPEKIRYPSIEKVGTEKKPEYKVTAEFKKFMDKLDESRNEKYPLFLLHPNGIENLSNVKGYIFKNYQERVDISATQYLLKPRIPSGTEPFSREWQLIADEIEQ